MLTRRRRRDGRPFRQVIAAWLAVAALLSHGLIPLGQGVALPAGAPWTGSTLVLCTAFGIKVIPDPDAPVPADDTFSCPICQINSLGKVLAAPAAAPLPLPLATCGTHKRTAGDLRVAGLGTRAEFARGPPLR